MFYPIPSRILAFAVASVALGGCASSSDRFPSLAIRDAERISGTFAVDPSSSPATPAATSPETLATVDSLLVEARSAHREFLAAVPGTERTVSAAGAGPESDSWASAQVALADLDSHRSSTAIALGELDLLYTDATLGFVERDQIDETRELVTALVSEEDAVLARLRGMIDQ